ncbi:MAG: T9SS type A sorting domain-containing protein [Bacteroidetes bacterium]|nr:T9SS type A sorting domain-containing protein [Bacteroidota bacterium]
MNLSINGTEPISTVTASDLAGKVVALYNLDGQKKTEFQLDLSALAKGMYILNVQSSGGNLKGKILIE